MPCKDFTNRPNAVDIFTGIRVSNVVLAVMFPSNILILLAVCVVIYLVKRNNNRSGRQPVDSPDKPNQRNVLRLLCCCMRCLQVRCRSRTVLEVNFVLSQ